MSLKNWEIVSIAINLHNFRGISVSYVTWSMEISLTEIELGPFFFRECSPIYFQVQNFDGVYAIQAVVKAATFSGGSRIFKKGSPDSEFFF